MLDSLTKTMSRSGGLAGGLNKKSNSSIGGVGGAIANVTAGSGTLSNGSHNSSTAGGRGTFQAQVIFLDDSGQVGHDRFTALALHFITYFCLCSVLAHALSLPSRLAPLPPNAIVSFSRPCWLNSV